MGELKHGFGAAKMNKDADERTIPNGEYREALNIQVVTSDGSDVGTMQTLLGNSKQVGNNLLANTLSETSSCVGAIADEQNNKIYYLVRDYFNRTDYIYMYDVDLSVLKPIVVDKWQVRILTSLPSTASPNTPATKLYLSDGGTATYNATNVRPGMVISGIFSGGTVHNISTSHQVVVNKMVHTPNGWEVHMDDLSSTTTLFSGSGLETAQDAMLTFTAKRALNFTTEHVTGINIIDNTLYWTDGENEPRKINVDNVDTDSSGLYHTKFLVKVNDVIVEDTIASHVIDFRENPDYIKEQHLTVIKKSPLYPPVLLLSDTANYRFSANTVSVLTSTLTSCFVDDNDSPLAVGSFKNVQFTPLPGYEVGDLVLLSRTNDFISPDESHDFELMVEILGYNTLNGYAKVKITYIDNILEGHLFGFPQVFNSTLKQEKPLYQFKFPRFAYRYKYQDNQYSTYSPFSEIAFMPGIFDYKPKDGYNLGMVNNLRSLYVCDFVTDEDALPKDVVEIDVVYKESSSNNVYVVKTVKRGESEWTSEGSSVNTPHSGSVRTTGALLITSEMVKAAVASNQLLRPWDNVPRSAKAQDMVGNRVVYANYLQNYNLK